MLRVRDRGILVPWETVVGKKRSLGKKGPGVYYTPSVLVVSSKLVSPPRDTAALAGLLV